ncbi:MAG: sterol desaturase family protein [Cyclobacteriaceae bacterium]|nr:sterol desaturase family protein [Cyclobacteriaceae bacterium]
MNANPIVLSIPIFAVLIILEVVIQWINNRRLYRLNDAVTNISCGITQQVSGVFLKLFGIGIYQLVFEHFAIWQIPTNWYTLIILFVATDFAYYWAHRMSHEINLFWSGHVVHHQSEDYNLSVALRQSSFQVIWTFAFYLPLAVIGFNTIDFALMAALTTLYQFWIHTELIGKLGFLEYILVTPSHHRVHHGRNPKYIDKNHGGAFIWWDMLFGTYQKEEERPTYGVTKPVNSWNPVWANFANFQIMGSELKQIPRFTDKVRYLFYKPGWYPKELGGYQQAPEIDKTSYKKYETKVSKILNGYVLYQFIATLGFTTWFLFNQADLALGPKAGAAALILITTITSGGLFELKNWVWWIEKIRLASVALIGGYLAYTNMVDIWLPIITTGYFLISMVWLFIAQRSLKNA